MARIEYGRHKVVVTGSDDAGKQVSKDAWNDDNEQLGVMGFDTLSEVLISSGVLSPALSPSAIIVGAESGTADDLDTITATDYQANDIIMLKSTSGDNINILNETGNIKTRNRLTIRLTGNVSIYFQYDGTDWREIKQNEAVIMNNTSLRVDPY